MLIRIMSDLHIEFYKTLSEILEYLDWTERDSDSVLVLAGDIGIPINGLMKPEKLYIEFLEEMKKRFLNVIIITGNHEYYRCKELKFSVSKVNKVIKDIADRLEITFLDKGSVVLNGVTFFGCAMFTDLKVKDSFGLNDCKQVCSFADLNKIHLNHSKWILNQKFPENSVMITHHVPIIIENGHSGFYTDMLSQIEDHSNIKYWFCGHTHKNVQETVGETEIVSCCIGYPGECERQLAKYVEIGSETEWETNESNGEPECLDEDYFDSEENFIASSKFFTLSLEKHFEFYSRNDNVLNLALKLDEYIVKSKNSPEYFNTVSFNYKNVNIYIGFEIFAQFDNFNQIVQFIYMEYLLRKKDLDEMLRVLSDDISIVNIEKILVELFPWSYSEECDRNLFMRNGTIYKIFEFCFSKNVDSDYFDTSRDAFMIEEYCDLFHKVQSVGFLKLLINNCTNVNQKFTGGNTALHDFIKLKYKEFPTPESITENEDYYQKVKNTIIFLFPLTNVHIKNNDSKTVLDLTVFK